MVETALETKDIFDQLRNWLGEKAIDLLVAVLILIIGRFLKKFVIMSVDKLCERSKQINPSAHGFIVACTKVTCEVFIIIAAISCMFNISSLIAALGAAGITASFALQGSLSNFVSGAQLVFSRPFEVGDFVQIGDYMGTCLKINVLNTLLNTIDNKRVVIPNSVVTGTTVINYSANNLRRVDLKYSVAYSTDLNKALGVLMKEAKKCTTVLKDPKPFVGVENHADSAVELILKVWINSTDYWDTYYFLQKNVKEAFDREKIEIPFPQIDVHNRD